MTTLFWLDVAAYAFSAVSALALGLMVLGSGPKHALNRLFTTFAVLEAAWAFSSLLLRMTLWLQRGSPALMLELATIAFALMGPVLLMFTARYVGRLTRWPDRVAALALAVTAVLSIFVLRHQIVMDPRLIERDMLYYDISTWGFLAALLPAFCMIWSLVLFWQERRQTGEPYLSASVLILLLGFAVGGLFSPPFPIMSITTTISVLVLGYGLISRQLLNPLQELTHDLERKVRERTGELEQRVVVEQEQRQQLQQSQEEIEKRIAAEQEQRAHLQRLIAQIRDTAPNLSSAAAEILAATTEQASGASEQAAAITQATATIDQVRTIAEQTAQRAQDVAGLSQHTTQVTQMGQTAVSHTIEGMEDVKRKVDSIAHEVLALSEQAQAIGGIINTVGQLATQSNMLALNASVEAARAGEAGKGFAVVAAEVRSLAQQSKVATEQVREILTEIQRGVNTAVMATEEGIKGTDSGLQLTDEARQAIQQLAESVQRSTQAAEQIAAAAGQQQSGMEQIASAMNNIHQVTTQNLAGARQVEQSAEKLSGLAGQLRELVQAYG